MREEVDRDVLRYPDEDSPGDPPGRLDSIPYRATPADPDVCVDAGLAAWIAGDADRASSWSRFAERALVDARSRSGRTVAGARNTVLRAAVASTGLEASIDAVDRVRSDLGPGVWSATASAVRGSLQLALGAPGRAAESWRDGAAEASIIGAAPIEVLCRSWLAVVSALLGHTAVATAQLAVVRQLDAERLLDGPEVPRAAAAVAGALVSAVSGDVRRAAADVPCAVHEVGGLLDADRFHQLHLRIALAHACLLVGERGAARALTVEASRLAAMTPEASWASTRVEELARQLDTALAELPHGRFWLTASELRVLRLLPTQLTLAEIASVLAVSTNTVKTHTGAVYRKLGASSRREATTRAVRCGILPEPSAAIAPHVSADEFAPCTCACHRVDRSRRSG